MTAAVMRSGVARPVTARIPVEQVPVGAVIYHSQIEATVLAVQPWPGLGTRLALTSAPFGKFRRSVASEQLWGPGGLVPVIELPDAAAVPS